MDWGAAETWPLRCERPPSLPSCFPGRLWETSPGLTQMWNCLIQHFCHIPGALLLFLRIFLFFRITEFSLSLPSLFPVLLTHPCLFLSTPILVPSQKPSYKPSPLSAPHWKSHESLLAASRHTHVNCCVLCAETGSEQGRAGQSESRLRFFSDYTQCLECSGM